MKKKNIISLLDNTDNSMRKKWDAIRTIINRKKINQNDCPIPSHILGQHYSQVADKLANELPNVLPDDIATSSSSFDNINIKSTLNGFSFVSTTNREIYELILQLDCSKGQNITIAIFMDLSKAFDTVDKTILSRKLNELGISDISTELINSYMSNRRFCIDKSNEVFKLNYGVPQGSILGPLLFIVYIYDMMNITKENKMIVYADDTTVLVKGRNLTETKQHCNDILQRFYDYFCLNKLSVNPLKTKYIIYKPKFDGNKNKKLLSDTTNTKLNMADSLLEEVSIIKFLGIMINNQLTWECHKQQIYNKVCRNLGIIYKCRAVMEEKEVIKMYKAFIQPYFLYGIEVWGHSVKSEKNILLRLQSKVLRIIFDCKRSGDAWIHNNYQIDNIQDLYYDVIKKLCTKHHAGLLPCKFAKSVMPEFYAVQLQNRVTRISLDQMYNYKNTTLSTCFLTHHSKQIVSKHGIICLLTIKLYHIPQTKKVYLNL